MSHNKPLRHQLPNCLSGIAVSSNSYSNFWEMMTAGTVIPVEYREGGLQMGMLFEAYLFSCARYAATKYKPAAWKYAYCDRGRQIFYMYPEWDYNVETTDTTFTNLNLEPQAFGFYITLFALNQYRHVALEKHWAYIYDALLMWALNRITDARMLEMKASDTPESLAELVHLENALTIIGNIAKTEPNNND